jgi:hypothetical protein
MPDAADVPADLVTRLVNAAESVIKNQRPALRHDPATLKSLTLELAIDRRGEVSLADVYVMRRISTSAILRARR